MFEWAAFVLTGDDSGVRSLEIIGIRVFDENSITVKYPLIIQRSNICLWMF